MDVIKRDGNKVDYDLEKISLAIEGVFDELNETFEESFVLEEIETLIKEKGYINKGYITVEQIQDIVEETLCDCGYVDEARAYIRYRYDHEIKRIQEQEKILNEKILAKNVENKNANLDEKSFGGRIGETSSVVLRQFALDHCMSKMAKENHLNNEIYIHDLDHYAIGDHNCLTLPLDDLLANGFTTRQTDVRPANSVSTAMQLVAVLFQLQSLCMFGGVSAAHLDWTMVPYVRKSFFKHWQDGHKYLLQDDINNLKFLEDKSIEDDYYKDKAYDYAIDMTKKEIHQAVEGLFHNLNTLQSRSGCQLPFSSINFGTCILPEGRLISKTILEVSIEGLGALHRTSIFPCSIFQCMSGVNRKPDEPNYDLFLLALKSTALRLYPNYVNCDWSGNTGYDHNDPKTFLATMGCRTVNLFDINGFGQLKDGRGNICPVTIILPTLAMEADRDVEKFFELLDKKIHEAKDMLLERFEYICSQSPDSARFMYENNTMAGYNPKEGIRSALKHGTLGIGQIAIAETCQLLVGCDHTEEAGMRIAKRIEQLYKDRCAEFKQEYKLNFANYFSPAESLCGSAMKKFKAKYGIIEKVSDHDYFTNSIHVPVWHQLSSFQKIDIESQLTGYSSGGCITYTELDGSVKHNIEALETLVNYAMDKDIPYFAINVPNDMCLECGFTDEFNDCCPMCGSHNIQQLRRVTGYLTGNYTTAFNDAKVAETEDRVKHSSQIKYGCD